MLDKTPKTDPTKLVNKKTDIPSKPVEKIVITPPNFRVADVTINGTAPYVMNRMSSASRLAMIAKQEAGEVSRKNKKREPKDFDKVFKSAMHVSTEGWYGIPASSIRSAMVSACRTVGYQMTRAKLCLFVEHDGIDAEDGSPLVKLNGTPKRKDIAVKLADGSTDIIPRPFFEKWKAVIRVKWDADQFSPSDVMNLMARVGVQVGIGAGRPDSKNSTGCGWGTFSIE
jgi:hypothetical protein